MVAIRLNQLSDKRLEKFHKSCAADCGNKARFRSRFLVDRRHIVRSGTQKQEKRLSLTDEHIAGVIRHGRLNHQNSKDEDGTVEIAVEGLIKNYQWVENTPGKGITLHTEDVQVRVVVRQRSPKNLVVTVYIEDRYTIPNLPEVNCEEWS